MDVCCNFVSDTAVSRVTCRSELTPIYSWDKSTIQVDCRSGPTLRASPLLQSRQFPAAESCRPQLKCAAHRRAHSAKSAITYSVTRDEGCVKTLWLTRSRRLAWVRARITGCSGCCSRSCSCSARLQSWLQLQCAVAVVAAVAVRG